MRRVLLALAFLASFASPSLAATIYTNTMTNSDSGDAGDAVRLRFTPAANSAGGTLTVTFGAAASAWTANNLYACVVASGATGSAAFNCTAPPQLLCASISVAANSTSSCTTAAAFTPFTTANTIAICAEITSATGPGYSNAAASVGTVVNYGLNTAATAPCSGQTPNASGNTGLWWIVTNAVSNAPSGGGGGGTNPLGRGPGLTAGLGQPGFAGGASASGGSLPSPPTFTAGPTATPSNTSAVVASTTSTPTTQIVSYGTTIAYGSTQSDPTSVTSHSITLSPLAAGQLYHYKVCATDAYSQSLCSADATFTTGAGGGNTLTSVSLSNSSFTCGTAGTVGVVTVNGTGSLGSTTLALSGADAAQFSLSTTTGTTANLTVGTSPAGCPRTYAVTVTATLAGATGSPQTVSPTITGSSPGSATLTSLTLNNSSFTCGAAVGTVVGAVNLTGTGSISGATLSLTGGGASNFSLSSSTLPANLLVATTSPSPTCPAASSTPSPTIGGVTYPINLVATLAGATGSPLTQPWMISSSNTPTTLLGTSLSTNTFQCGTAQPVGLITVKGTNVGGATLALSGTDAANFSLSSTTLPATLNVIAAPAGCPRSYNINIVATLVGAVGSPSTQAWTLAGVSSVACPYGSTGSAVGDGCTAGQTEAVSGFTTLTPPLANPYTIQHSDFFTGSFARQSGQSWVATGLCANANCHPPWNVAGVDYPVGVHKGVTLKDPSTSMTVPGCTFCPSGYSGSGCNPGYTFNNVTCVGQASYDIEQYNFAQTAHGCVTLWIYNTAGGAGSTLTLKDNVFGLGATCLKGTGSVPAGQIGVIASNQNHFASAIIENNFFDFDGYNVATNITDNYTYGIQLDGPDSIVVAYNAFRNSAIDFMLLSPWDNGTLTMLYNYTEGEFCANPSPHCHHIEETSRQGAAAGSVIAAINTGYHTFLANSVDHGGTALNWTNLNVATPTRVVTNKNDYNSVVVSNALASDAIICGGQCLWNGMHMGQDSNFVNVAAKNNYFDGKQTGTQSCLNYGQPTALTPPVFTLTGNVEMTTGQAVNNLSTTVSGSNTAWKSALYAGSPC